jgi:hypothetical protein
MTTPIATKVYPAGAWRVNINASLADGEVMTNTVWLLRDAAASGDITSQKVADRVAEHWTNFITTAVGTNAIANTQFADSTVWTNATAYKVDAAGRAVEQAVANFAAGVKGTNASRLPLQLAIAVTLKTNRAGRSGRGRIFLGGLGANLLGQSGRVSLGQRDALSLGLQRFYTDLRNSTLAGDDFRPVIVSPTTGTSNKITSLSVGDVFDTMRSRRNKLVEQRVSQLVDAS